MPSTVVSAIEYFSKTSTLRITFVSGTIYDYKKVPQKLYHELKQSSSKGTFLNKHIKGFYSYKKINSSHGDGPVL